MTSQSYQNKMN